MNDKNIELDIKITEKVIDEYYSKMNVLKQSKTIIFLIITMIAIIITWIIEDIRLSIFLMGFLLTYILIIVKQQSTSRNISKKLLQVLSDHCKCIITKENIKIIYEDEEIKNKIDYNNISLVYESNNIFIILYNLSTRVLVIPKNSLNEEQTEEFKRILSTNLTSDKIKKYKMKKLNLKVFKYVSIVLLFLVFIIVAFTYTEEKYDVKYYSNFVNEQSYKYYGTKEIFPVELPQSAKDIKYNFKYKYKIVKPNPSYQVYLEYTLDESDFDNEIKRLQKFNCNTENFKYDAYGLINPKSNIYEYALVNESEKKIIYIFLQEIDNKDSKIEKEYLPNDI